MDVLTILPPVVAIAVAIALRNVYIALISGLVLSETLMVANNPAMGVLKTADRTVAVFADQGNVRVLLFCLLIGVLIAFMRDSGGVAATARAMLNSGFAKTRRRAELSVAATGSTIFVETNVSLLSAGILGRPLYDAHGLSRERLAYMIDSTSAPISVILLLNAWGAYADRLVEPYGFSNSFGVVLGSIPWNFYAFATLALVFATAYTGKVFGPMKSADARVQSASTDPGVAPTKVIYMALPLILMIGGALAFMTWTGNGDITKGSGSQSILWAIIVAIILTGLLLRIDKVFNTETLQKKAFDGISEMVPLVTVLLLSIAFGASLRELGTGAYIAEVGTAVLAPFAVPALLFAAAGATSFFSGTSWGTYGILVPIAMPLAQALGIPPSLALAAVLGGGVFGDHASPISDTTLIASVAAGSDHLSHVKTQLPYALVAAVIAILLYLLAGWITT